ncbi:MAG: hypothetical protein K2R98_06740 [Gemmataceae bacterium]|nr:hypothetical protein [Gemmataceae bacterium]
MRRTKLLCLCLAAVLTILAVTVPVQALVMAPSPIPDRVALADIIIIGKVTAIEDKTVMAKRFPDDKEKAQFGVGVVEVEDGIIGAKAKAKIRIGFVPPPPPNPNQPQIGGGRNRFPALTPTVGQEACWFLTKHIDGDFYTIGAYFNVIGKKDNANFQKEVDLVKRCAKLLNEPAAGLKSKDPEDRLLTAGMLIIKYRTPRQFANNPKSEAIDAEQSKLILEALASADWTKRDPITQASPYMYFNRLGLTDKDGWMQPKDGNVAAAAQKWIKDNAGKYRVQRYMADAK